MKILNCLKASSRKFHRGLLIGAALGLASPAISSLAQVSPVGTWDLQLSGAMQGIAYVTFDENFGLSGYELLQPKLSDNTESGRETSSDGRTGITTVNTNVTVHGFALLSGSWSYDPKGRVVGFYTEGSENRVCTTNNDVIAVVSNSIIDYKTNIVTITVTNYVTNTSISCVTSPLTNGLSFTAVVRPSRLTMKSTTSYGNITFHGRPAVELPDISGTYYAQGKKTGNPDFVEFITLTPGGQLNVYEISGQGAGYDVGGLGIFSSTKRLAVVLNTTATNSVLTTGYGPYDVRRGRANLTTEDLVSVIGRYKIFKQAPLP
jgi:hypothetical protein